MAQAKQNPVKDTRKRVLLVDDHAVVRFGMAQLINQQGDLVVCGEEESATNASAPSAGSSRTLSSPTSP